MTTANTMAHSRRDEMVHVPAGLYRSLIISGNLMAFRIRRGEGHDPALPDAWDAVADAAAKEIAAATESLCARCR